MLCGLKSMSNIHIYIYNITLYIYIQRLPRYTRLVIGADDHYRQYYDKNGLSLEQQADLINIMMVKWLIV